MPEAKSSRSTPRGDVREWIAAGFTRAEDVVYIGLALLLAVSALTLLAAIAYSAGQALLTGELPARVVDLLDRILLILMIVEILYTVQVSFREHTLSPEPFLIVGLIAATRRVLVLTAEFSELIERGDAAFRNAMIELGLLTVMVFVLVASLVMLRRRGVPAVAERS
jgi:Phosphate-starvation-inducible E family